MEDASLDIVSPQRGRTGRPRREESGEIDRRLVEAAMRMFVQSGSGVTMNAIVEASGLSRKTVYARYANKSALFLAVMRHLLKAGEDWPVPVVDEGPVEEALYRFILMSLREVCHPEGVALRRLLMLDADNMEQMKPNIERVVVRRYMDPLLLYLRRRAADGTIRIDEPIKATECLASLILAESHRQFFLADAPRDDELEKHARYLARLFCYGILGAPDAPA